MLGESTADASSGDSSRPFVIGGSSGDSPDFAESRAKGVMQWSAKVEFRESNLASVVEKLGYDAQSRHLEGVRTLRGSRFKAMALVLMGSMVGRALFCFEGVIVGRENARHPRKA